MRESEAVYLVGVLAAGFAREIARETVGIYAEEIVSEDYEIAHEAIRRLIRTREFFPPVSVVLEAIRAERANRRPALPPAPVGDGVTLDELPPEAKEAWRAMRALVSRWGSA